MTEPTSPETASETGAEPHATSFGRPADSAPCDAPDASEDSIATTNDGRPSPVPGARLDRGDDRGQSELIGFVLSFSMIILSVGLVYTVGFGALEQVRDGERANSAERTLEGLAATYENLQRGDPARASEIRLSGGRLGVNNDTEMTFEVDAGGTTVTETRHPRSLVYTSADTRISYVGGAVFRSENGGTVIVHAPRMSCTADRAIVSIPTLNGSATVGGDSSAVLKARLNETELLYPPDQTTLPSDATQVSIDITSPDAQGWDRYLTGAGWSKSGSTYTCTTDKVVVRNARIDLSFFI